MNAEWWFAWILANGTPLLIALVVVLWMRGLWRKQIEGAEAMLVVANKNADLLRQAVARLEEIRDNIKGKI